MTQNFYEVCNNSCPIDSVLPFKWEAARPNNRRKNQVHLAEKRSCKIHFLQQLLRRYVWLRFTAQRSGDFLRLQQRMCGNSWSSCVPWYQQFQGDMCERDVIELQTHHKIDETRWKLKRKRQKWASFQTSFFQSTAGSVGFNAKRLDSLNRSYRVASSM